MESWFTSTAVLFMMRMSLSAGKCIRKVYKSFPISRGISGTYSNLSVRATGCLGLHRRNIIRFMIWMQKRWDALGLKTWYYTTHLHRGAFMLPKYVEDLLEEEETK